ncbi:Eco57I restriction-modification methylase domain-containing protein [Chloroflexota bacterium]
MNRNQAYTLIRQTFTQAFDKNLFSNFSQNLLNHIDESKAVSWNSQDVKNAFKEHIQRYERLGTYTSPENEKLDILIVYLTNESKLERARTAIRNFVADHLKTRDEKDAALVAFVSPSEATWRFSYVKMEYATVEKDSGRIGVETRLTPARRFSYIVGEGESCHTAQTRFLDLLQDTDTDPVLVDIEEAFSVEAVTEEFFTEYVELFEEIHKALDHLVDEDKTINDEFTIRGLNTVDFSKKLMGQVVFLYFLQKKGWLGISKGQDWGDGPRNFLRRLAREEYCKYDNFFNDILEPLFYDTLATDRGHEAWCECFKCRIPFLNGGLFEPLCDYDWRKTDIVLPNRLFTNSEFVEEGIVGTGVLDVFDRYNFTVNEAEPLEKEVAIDPEMLGKVFENLIEENRRKGLGAFYTPREIVHYMCQESLVNYLDTAINKEMQIVVSREEIETFVHLGEQISHYESVDTNYPIKMPNSIEKHARLIDEKLAEITVCDPAVGSGAFPVGMMIEIVRARCTLTPYFNSVQERTSYHFKRHAIQKSLYGVDIDAGAVEIAKLRLWLSLVVDEEDVKQIKPLPNLDYKIMQGNSLISEFMGIGFDTDEEKVSSGFHFADETDQLIEEFQQRKTEFLNESDRDRKEKLRNDIDNLIVKIFEAKLHKQKAEYLNERERIEQKYSFVSNQDQREGAIAQEIKRLSIKTGFYPEVVEKQFKEFIGSKKVKPFFLWKLYFSEVFHQKGGFDVVIANPPYNAKLTDDERADYKKRYKSVSSGRQDTAVIFIEIATLIAPSRSVVNYVLPYRLFSRKRNHGQFQLWLLKNHDIHEIIYIGTHPGFSANDEFMLLRLSTGRSIVDTIDVAFKPQLGPEHSTISFTRTKQSMFLELGEINLSLLKYDLNLLRKIVSGSVMLESVCKVRDGIVPYIREKLVSDQKLDHRYVRFAGVAGKYELRRYHFSCDNLYLCYDINEAKKYIEDPIELRKVQFRDREIFLSRKIITSQNSATLKGTIDEDKLFVSNSIHSTYLKPEWEKKLSLEYILGLINSTLMDYFHNSMRVKATDLHPQILVTNLNKLPIKIADTDIQNVIVSSVKKILTAKQCDPEADTTGLERQIDRMVYELYGLSPEEIGVVEGKANIKEAVQAKVR